MATARRDLYHEVKLSPTPNGYSTVTLARSRYDWSFFVRESDFHGVWGDNFGAWVLNPGKDYYNGDQLKQVSATVTDGG
jgi:rhamnogalacturonan endolyase